MQCLRGKKIFTLFRRFASNVNIENNSSVLDLYTNKPLGLTTTVKGWVKAVRKLKDFTFINLNDGSCSESIQVVLPRSLYQSGLSYGSSVSITGKLQSNQNGKIEISARKLEVIGKCEISKGYPFTPGQRQSFEYYRQHLHHRPKLTFFSSMLRTRHSSAFAVHKFFNDNKFVWVHTPILTANDCEGAGETFIVQPSDKNLTDQMKKEGFSKEDAFFNSKAFLSVSGQLHLEALARSIPKVYSFSPTFRAENSKSRLHLSEFYMVEAEEAFVSCLEDILNTIEALTKHLISNLILHCEKDIKYIFDNNEKPSRDHVLTLDNSLQKPFTVMHYSEAKRICQDNRADINYEKPPGLGFTKEEELFLVKHNGNVPIFVVNWPKELKPAYMKSTSHNPDEVEAVDLLVPVVGELCGGGIREDDFDALHQKLTEIREIDNLDWYLQLRRFGNIPTGGFGMGFDRFLQYGLNIDNIKDTIPFPRWPHNLQL